MALAPDDRRLVEDELGRAPTDAEAALFENLWSEHCAYRSSRPLLDAFETDGSQVVVGPGDDAGIVRLTDEWYLALGIESHNHPSYVDPYDGAATGVGGIVRDILSMGAYPIGLADCLYFGEFTDEHAQYLFEGVVEGIADYGNAIGVPTVTGSVHFDGRYEGNPLVNVACVGLVSADRLLRAAATTPGNKLVIVGNATGRDGLGGASFASEDLDEDAETEDRPAVQVGDPYTEKLLIEANEALLDEGVVEAARDLGAAGLGGATSEMVAQGETGAAITLDRLHQREPNMTGLELLLAESQERMCYEVRPEHVETVRSIADRYDLASSVIGEVTDDGRYRCTFEGETVVDVPASFLADGAPMNDLPTEVPEAPPIDVPELPLRETLSTVIESPNTAAKEWVFRQYDHEVGIRTARRPGDDAALLAIRETGQGLALAAGSEPKWTAVAPFDGARAVALEVATNLAAKGATPLAAVDCINGGNPERPTVYHGFSRAIDGLADMCAALEVPVVGGNVSLYNDSPTGPVPPTPTLAMFGVTGNFSVPPHEVEGGNDLVLVGEPTTALGGSEILAERGGYDDFPTLPTAPAALVAGLQEAAVADSTLAVHDVSHGGLAVTLAEMVSSDAGVSVTIDEDVRALVSETPGRTVVETTAPATVHETLEGIVPTTTVGSSTLDGSLSVTCRDGEVEFDVEELTEMRAVIDRTLDGEPITLS